MKPKSIGIVGGAGPLAGVSLLQRLVSLSVTTYGCQKDSDFPEIILLSHPFSEMLSPEMNVSLLRKELSDCLNRLRRNGANVLAIACNTLHAFLDESETEGLIHLPQIVAARIPPSEKPLVLCTSTSALYGVHRQFFPCIYPEFHTQILIDIIIEKILKGADPFAIVHELSKIIEEQPANTIVLGSTELSLFFRQLSPCGKRIIDPLEIASVKILEKSFGEWNNSTSRMAAKCGSSV